VVPAGAPVPDGRARLDPAPRLRRQFEQLRVFLQRLARESARRRDEFWAAAGTGSAEEWRASCRPYRDYLWEHVIGRCPPPDRPPAARTRLAYDRPLWVGYEVRLGVLAGVFAAGVLLVPRDLRPDERRPVVVCQHGLGGRPHDVVDAADSPYYRKFASRLAERGYVVYAPQNLYVGEEEFRRLQRKANPLRWSLFGFMVRQHQQTLAWLKRLSFVDPHRIAFYGLSYGGESALRLPAILEDYCLSICSGDFNEFVVKTVGLDFANGYMFNRAYEIYDFDLANTFNHAELAGLIAPRPFMVERGHRDGVGLDEWVAFEYARVRRRYADLGIPGRTAIHFFEGGHVIDGTETFAFLDRHLSWSPRTAAEPRTGGSAAGAATGVADR
jgi:hypothetical protein